MTDEEMIAWLRAEAELSDYRVEQELFNSIADRIEAKLADVERLNDLVADTAEHWMTLQSKHPIQWEGAIDSAMAAGCAEIEALRADNAKLREANGVLRLGLLGTIDSDDARTIAWSIQQGEDIDWAKYSEATRKALIEPRVLFASLHNRELTDAEIDQIIKDRKNDR